MFPHKKDVVQSCLQDTEFQRIYCKESWRNKYRFRGCARSISGLQVRKHCQIWTLALALAVQQIPRAETAWNYVRPACMWFSCCGSFWIELCHMMQGCIDVWGQRALRWPFHSVDAHSADAQCSVHTGIRECLFRQGDSSLPTLIVCYYVIPSCGWKPKILYTMPGRFRGSIGMALYGDAQAWK